MHSLNVFIPIVFIVFGYFFLMISFQQLLILCFLINVLYLQPNNLIIFIETLKK